jgi:hypothetical protein
MMEARSYGMVCNEPDVFNTQHLPDLSTPEGVGQQIVLFIPVAVEHVRSHFRRSTPTGRDRG